jgi:hypothetical protein
MGEAMPDTFIGKVAKEAFQPGQFEASVQLINIASIVLGVSSVYLVYGGYASIHMMILLLLVCGLVISINWFVNQNSRLCREEVNLEPQDTSVCSERYKKVE